VNLEDGKVVRNHDLSSRYFGEGLTAFGDKLIQLTYRTQIGFVYDRETFDVKGSFVFAGEGWGLTHDDKQLIASDGTASLRYLDPMSFQEMRRLKVVDKGQPVVNLNELEYINDEIFANVWQTDKIAVISPKTGEVMRWIDLGKIHPAKLASPEAVLNGIAYDAKTERIFVTGKFWPNLFEIRPVCPK
jgi:glutamine cyclotransferase